MTTINLNLEIPSLQAQTIRTLTNINNYLATNPSLNEQKKKEYSQQIAKQIDAVNNLEMILSIIAPMKAGKSTIINALTGLEIMPTHSDAMTTFPTEVVFDPQLSEPSLILTPEILSVFNNTISILQEKIHNQGIEWAQKTTQAYPHLESILERISEGIYLTNRVTETKQINETLTLLNHIIRLSTLLKPEHKPLQEIKQLPRVETPFWRETMINPNDSAQALHGKLVLVDTPGPNEAGQNGIRGIVTTQLQKSASILIVLDFTTLRSQAAADIKEEVKKIIQLRGEDNLYIVVNKVDVRKGKKSGYLTPEEVKQFVKSEFELSNDHNVFEISAQWALYATRLLRKLANNPNLSMEEIINLKQTEDFASEIYGFFDWEERLAESSKEKLEKDAQKLWNRSGFAHLLDEISTLVQTAEHSCLRTGLKMGSQALRELYHRPPLLIDRVTKVYTSSQGAIKIGL